jgi:ribose transport system permease protein
MTDSQTQGFDGEKRFRFAFGLGGGSAKSLLLAVVASREFGVIVGLIATFIFFTAVEPRFLSVSNIFEMAVQSSIIALMALGMTLVIVTGGIDLSVGAILGLISVILATNLETWGTYPTIIIGLLLGAFLGFLNGSFAALFKLETFVVTLATLNIYRGLAFLYTEGRPVFGLDAGFRDLLGGRLFDIPRPVLIVLVATLIAFLILNRSRLGVHLKAIGTNSDAARKAGINVKKTSIMAFVLSGVFTGAAALMLLSRIGAAEPISGTGYELLVIAAVVVGGTSLQGGRASIVGTILGAFLLGAIRTGLTLMNVEPFTQLVVTGVIILIAVVIDRLSSKKTETR